MIGSVLRVESDKVPALRYVGAMRLTTFYPSALLGKPLPDCALRVGAGLDDAGPFY